MSRQCSDVWPPMNRKDLMRIYNRYKKKYDVQYSRTNAELQKTLENLQKSKHLKVPKEVLEAQGNKEVGKLSSPPKQKKLSARDTALQHLQAVRSEFCLPPPKPFVIDDESDILDDSIQTANNQIMDELWIQKESQMLAIIRNL